MYVQVLRVNGVEVLNLAHLKQLIMGKGSRGSPAAAAVEPSAEPTAADTAITQAAAAELAAEAAGNGSSSSGQQQQPAASSSNGSSESSAVSASSSSSAASSSSSSLDESCDGELEVGSAAWDERFIQIELEDDRQIIMERSAASEATERLQRRYRVPYLCSADLAD